MLTVIRDQSGNIEVACEWTPVDNTGKPTSLGTYVWVNQIESNGNKGAIRRMINEIYSKVPWVIGAYWYRESKTGQRIHQHKIERLSSLAKHYQEVI